MKQRIVIRLHLAVRAVLQSEADWRGTRLGTLTSELIHEQAAKARLCGVQNYELNPVSSRYVPVTNGTKYKQTSGLEQISIYLNDEDMQTLKELALAKGFRHVASAPLARSSYKAWEALEDVHDLY